MILLLILVTLVVGLIVFGVYHLRWNVRHPIPGLEPSDPKEGNWRDIRRAGSVHEFLVDLHAKKGGIASFWMGPQRVVSLASPELFKAVTKLHNRPAELFALIDMLSTTNSIVTATDEDWRWRRTIEDPAFSHSAMSNYFELLSDTMNELVTRLDGVPTDEHIGLMKYMYDIVVKNITRCILGADFSDENIDRFCHGYNICWAEIERHMAGDIPAADSERMQTFYKMREEMVEPIRKAVEHRRQYPAKPGEQFLVDVLIEHEVAEDVMFADLITYLVAGYHTTAQLFVWLIYYIALHPEVQTKLYEELQVVIGDGEVTPGNIEDLTYTRQVIDETMRISVIGTWTGRILDEDFKLAGYTIPAKTPILQAVGAVMLDPKIWPEPYRFDPERFSAANMTLRPNFCFEPFGFAGKRKCPGYRLTYLEATIFLSLLIPNFRFQLVEGQKVSIEYGFVSKPTSEIWVDAQKRK